MYLHSYYVISIYLFQYQPTSWLISEHWQKKYSDNNMIFNQTCRKTFFFFFNLFNV